MFSKILIANRGEIAVRIIRACKEMGIATVAIYSQADKEALHVALADESYCVGGASPADSYLNEERVIAAALVSGAQAIHPGYGFLSENAHFASLCRRNGLVFIGPTPESMEALSDKAGLKDIMKTNGLEVIPGTQALPDVTAALNAAAQIGYPVMLKASAGGGGRGIRLVQLEESWQLISAPRWGAVIRGLLARKKPDKLSASALETLALVAYFQPVTRVYLDQARGVDSAHSLGVLLDRELVEPCGTLDAPGRPTLYRTTQTFLRSFGLSDLADLPPLPEGIPAEAGGAP